MALEHLMDSNMEREVLSCCYLQDPTIVANIRAVLEPADFTVDTHRRIFRAVCRLADAGRQLTTTEVYNSCREHNEPVELGYLVEDLGMYVFALDSYMVRLKELTKRRRLILQAKQLQNDAGDLTVPVSDIASRTHLAVAEALGCAASESPEDTQAIIEASGGTEAFLRIAPGIRSPWQELDKFTGGWQRGELILIGARPSMGKTALALNALIGAAGAGTPSVFYSFEMTRESILRRLICLRVGISYQELAAGNLNPSERHSVNEAIAWLAELPLRIVGASGRTALAIRVHAERLAQKEQCGFFIVDYIGIVKAMESDQNRNRQLGAICRQFKETAASLNIPAMVLSQLNRAVASRDDKRPGLSDLRDSGELEEHADMIAFLHRPGYYNRNESALERVAELIIAKQRNGDTPIINLEFQRRCGRFESPEKPHEEEPRLWA